MAKARTPWHIFAKNRIAIQNKDELVKFLLDMGYTNKTISELVGVTAYSINNWRRYWYPKSFNDNKGIRVDKQPFLVCDRFSFKNKVDPTTTKRHDKEMKTFKEVYEIFNEVMKEVSEQKQRIVKGRLSGKTFQKISDEENFTRQNICLIYEQVMDTIRNRYIVRTEKEF